MEFNVSIDGAAPESPRWILCPGRATVIVNVRWRPPQTADAAHSQRPACGLTYLTTPGASTGALPTAIELRRDDNAAEWAGAAAVTAPPFSPLRVRVELQPAFGRAHVGVLHIVPVGSAWTATGLVVASLVTVVALLMLTLATLRLTLTQALTGLTGLGVLSAAWVALNRTLSTLKPGHLPYLGITYLVHRAALACVLGFAAVIAGLQSCVVVIHNDTAGELRFVLPWRDGEEPIVAHGRISVVPPDGRSFRASVLDHLPETARDRPLCVDDGSDREGSTVCRRRGPAPVVTPGAWLRGLFTPPTLTIRCGRQWPGLTPTAALDAPPDVHAEGEHVWFEPTASETCERGERAALWYEVDGAAHRVRYPWQPAALADVGRLSLDPNDDGRAPAEVTLASVGDEAGDLQETRISLAPGRPLARDGWPVAGLRDASRAGLRLQIGDLLRRASESFAFAAELACDRSQAHGTMFHATRLELVGPPGWLGALVAGSGQGTGWTSTWTLGRAVGTQAVVPWICEALPGDRPQLTKRVGFAASKLDLTVDVGAEAVEGEQALVVPAYLMARSVNIGRQGPGEAVIGRIECPLVAGDSARIELVRVHVDDHRDGQVRSFAVAHAGEPTAFTRWIAGPAAVGSGDRRPVAWLCWNGDIPRPRAVELDVTPLDEGHTSSAIRGTWEVAAGTLVLRSRGQRVCFYNAAFGVRDKLPAGARRDGKPRPATDFRIALPQARGCDVVQNYVLSKESP